MDKFVIAGGAALVGEIPASGSKNSALPALAAALLTEEPVTLHRIPRVRDIRTIERLLVDIGSKVDVDGETVRLQTPAIVCPEAPYELVKTMRASSLVLGPLVARCGRARVSLPGGCAIGARPINLHIFGLEQLGARIHQAHGYIEAEAPEGLHGAVVDFDRITVTGTEDLLMAAVLARGETVLRNAAREPEVADLADLLTKMGARIEGAGTSVIRIQGVERLHGTEHRIIADRIEAGTFLIAGAITGGDLTVTGCIPEHLGALVSKLQQTGAELTQPDAASLRVRVSAGLRSVDMTTEEYPGFATDPLNSNPQLSQFLRGHRDAVYGVAFSPDGGTLASASRDSTVILWDAKTRTRRGEPLAGHTTAVRGVAFSPDGGTLASASDDKTVILWDAKTRTRRGEPLAGHTAAVYGVAFSPDGGTLASASHDSTVILWDAKTRTRLGAPLAGHTNGVTSVAFSPDGGTLASASQDRTVILWDAKTRTPLGAPLAGHTNAVTSVAFSPDGGTLASASYDKTVILWDVKTRRPLGAPLAGHTDAVTSVAFSPDGGTLASASATTPSSSGTSRRARGWASPSPGTRAPCGAWRSAPTAARSPPPPPTTPSSSGTPRRARGWARPSPGTGAPCSAWRSAPTAARSPPPPATRPSSSGTSRCAGG